MVGKKGSLSGDREPVNPTIYNINVRIPEEAVRLQQALAKTPKPTPTVPTKTVVPPKVPAPVVTVAKPHYVAPPQPTSTASTFYDASTGLQWQDNRDAKTVKKDWEGAKNYCANLTLDGYSDWRLPSIEELESIVDTSRTPTIKKEFKNTTDKWYWSASPVCTVIPTRGSSVSSMAIRSSALRQIRIMCGV